MLCTRHVKLARQAGALTVLPIALRSRIFVHRVFAGELDEGAALMPGGARGPPEVTGTQLPAYGAVALAAWRGREAEAGELIKATIDDRLTEAVAKAWG